VKPDLEALLAKWKPILRVSDWEIKIKWVKQYAMGNNDADGTCCHTAAAKAAVIKILEPEDFDPGSGLWLQDVEDTVVHEMLHLHFAALPRHEGTDHIVFEQAIVSLTSALLDRDRAPKQQT
jgi:hypothetical protein